MGIKRNFIAQYAEKLLSVRTFMLLTPLVTYILTPYVVFDDSREGDHTFGKTESGTLKLKYLPGLELSDLIV